MYLNGDWKINDYLTFTANTHGTDGVAADAASVPTYRIYEDETGTPILTGSMAKLDDANTIGFYSERIQLTGANGFEIGKCYTIYITATVAGDVGTTSHSFGMAAVDETIFYLGGQYAGDDNDGHTERTAVATWDKLFNATTGLVYNLAEGPATVYILSDQNLIAEPNPNGSGVVRRTNAGSTRVIGIGRPLVKVEHWDGGANAACTITLTIDDVEVTGLRITQAGAYSGIDLDGVSHCHIHRNEFIGKALINCRGAGGEHIIEYNVCNTSTGGVWGFVRGGPVNEGTVSRVVVRHNIIHHFDEIAVLDYAEDWLIYDNHLWHKSGAADAPDIRFKSNAVRCIAVNNYCEGRPATAGFLEGQTGCANSNTADYRVLAVAAYKSLVLTVIACLERSGQAITSCTSCTVTVYDADGAEQFEISDDTADAQGVFKLTKSSPGLTAGRAYYAAVAIAYSGKTYSRVIPFTAR